MERPIAIAKIGRFRGTRGEVYVHPHIDLAGEPLQGAAALIRWQNGREATAQIESIRGHSGKHICKLSISNSMDEARSLVHAEIIVDRETLTPEEDDEFFVEDLQGLAVVDSGGKEIGTVAGIIDYGAHSLLKVQGPGEILIPFTGEIVVEVDLEAGKVIVDPPEGLLEINEV